MLFNGGKRRVTNIRLKTVCLGRRGTLFRRSWGIFMSGFYFFSRNLRQKYDD